MPKLAMLEAELKIYRRADHRLIKMYAEHREVVVWFGAVAMFFYFGCQAFDNLL